MKAFIKHIATYFPEKSLSNQEISEKFPEWDSEKIIQKIGVRNRFNSGEDEFVSDMATKVSEKLFSENNFDRSSVDFVLLYTITRLLSAYNCLYCTK
jgi:3-oxoacyl-[acyl-carrier-protein] synthase-3